MDNQGKRAPIDILNAAFAPRKHAERSSNTGYGHPHGENIIKGAKRILSHSGTGQELLAFVEEESLKIKVLKDNKQSGYIPSSEIAVITCPASQTKVTPDTVLNFIRAVREAEQEKGGLTSPTLDMSEDDYVKRDIEKQEDIFVTQFEIAWELKQNMDIEDLIIALRNVPNMKNYVDLYVKHMVDLSEENQ